MNKATLEKRAGLDVALADAFAALGPERIDQLSPAGLLLVAMREAAKAGHIPASVAIAKDAAPYFDAKLSPKAVPLDDEGVSQLGYAVIPQQAESMDAWAKEAQRELAPKSGDPNPDPKSSS